MCLYIRVILRGRKEKEGEKLECKINFFRSLISQANRGIFPCIRKFAEDRAISKLDHCVRVVYVLNRKE